ncbi:MAG TPA: sigma-54 dependent transcriptional regulator [Vicinamibacterales bacterium]|nr:sigma-54 dependent transcriptional regulator [Vicinamibacterales bacterium]
MTSAAGPAGPTLLVADDDPAVRSLVDGVAAPLGFTLSQATGRSALQSLSQIKPDAAIVDVFDMDGAAVLRQIHASDPHCPVILTTKSASVDEAIAAIRDGALDYLTKPLQVERLREVLVTVRKQVERRETFLRLDADVAKQFEFYGMVGRGPVMQELFDAIRRVAPHLRTVLVTGETGTGKELVAKALHRLGPRKDKRLLTVNCSAVVETLFESELFGHMRGAFTGATENKLGLFEHANGGTVFLDEIGELPPALQAKLLRTVEYGEVQRVGALETRQTDVCVIAATNRDLMSESAGGRFRSDLYYRLAILELHLVPLRDRREDIPYLTAVFIRECAERLKRSIVGLSPAAERLLQLAPWPGNVRQLRHVIERACLMSDGRMLTEREVAATLAAAAGPAKAPQKPAREAKPEPNRLSTAQREQIERVLQQVRGNKTAAAQQLGVSRRSLYRWLERLDIPS